MDTRVLIVDDSLTGRKLLKKSLPAALAAEVTEAASGEDAVRICASQAIDLMFLDLTMPGLTGYDVLMELRKSPASPVVVVVSGDVQTLAQERVKELGAFAFIRKPIDAARLENVLKEARFL
jgi:two-component system, chemotaxis family, chemotaxis protein CheY